MKTFGFGLLSCLLTATGCHRSQLPYDAGPGIDAATDGAAADASDAMPLPPEPDAGPIDAGPPGPSRSEYRACENGLLDDWTQEPVSLGIARRVPRETYSRVLGKLMGDFTIPGAAVAVSRDGKLVLALGLGLGDIEDAQPARPDSLFRVAGLSRQLTALAIMKLVEDEALALDDPAFTLLGDPEPPEGTTRTAALSQVHVRHLLQHSGGWNRDKESVGDPMFDPIDIAASLFVSPPAQCDTIIRYMQNKPLTYAPGSTACESNFGYCVLGRVIEVQSHMPYAQYVSEAVLAGAGVVNMRLGHSVAEERAPGEVRYYEVEGAPRATSVFTPSERVPWPYGGFHLEAMAAHDGWLASAVDMLRVQAAIDGEPTRRDVLEDASRTTMLAHPNLPECTELGGATPPRAEQWFGYGVSVNAAGDVSGSGALAGSAGTAVIEHGGFSWVALFNSRSERAQEFLERVDVDLRAAHTAVGAGEWGTDDLFDQYASLGAWLDAEAFAREIERQRVRGRYPSAVEGRVGEAGALELRGMFVPVRGFAPVVVTGVDCFEYRAAAAEQVDAGRSLVSVQSVRDARGVRRYQAVWVK